MAAKAHQNRRATRHSCSAICASALRLTASAVDADAVDFAGDETRTDAAGGPSAASRADARDAHRAAMSARTSWYPRSAAVSCGARQSARAVSGADRLASVTKRKNAACGSMAAATRDFSPMDRMNARYDALARAWLRSMVARMLMKRCLTLRTRGDVRSQRLRRWRTTRTAASVASATSKGFGWSLAATKARRPSGTPTKAASDAAAVTRR
mmetsp:Transcript_20167/g.68307  ORF Transcript_20167/g.68307 Transcript_20167/m.68307 type:complete len:212 (-) Transcript_20167:175-810(-)